MKVGGEEIGSCRLRRGGFQIENRNPKIGNEKRGFTLIELLVVISIISILLTIGFPVYNKVRRQARAIVAAQNQKEITTALNIFAMDNNERYPQSVATVGTGDSWNWSDPTKLTGTTHRSPGMHRAMSEYLKSYLPDARTMYCPNAPQRYKYLQQAWDAGDNWDYPDDEAFAIVVESENYTMQVSPAGPGSRLSPAEYGIHILPKRNITREYSEDEVNKYLLSLGILKTYAQLSFSRGLRLGGFSPFGEAPEIDYQPDFFETISYYAIPHTGNPDLDHFISYYGPYIILIAVASALFVAAFRLIRRGGSR